MCTYSVLHVQAFRCMQRCCPAAMALIASYSDGSRSLKGAPEAMFRPGSLCSMPSVFVRQFPRWSLIV